MDRGYHILINTNLEKRVENIVDDYVNNTSGTKDSEIEEAIKRLRKRIGGDKVDTLIEELHKKNYSKIARELMINYYDPLYEYSIEKYKKYDKIIDYNDIELAVMEIMNYVDSLNYV